jgi:hypothetical protein
MKKPRIAAAVGIARGRGSASAAGTGIAAAAGTAKGEGTAEGGGAAPVLGNSIVTAAVGIADVSGRRRGRQLPNQKRHEEAVERRTLCLALATVECSEDPKRSNWSASQMARHIKKKHKKLARKVSIDTIRKALRK